MTQSLHLIIIYGRKEEIKEGVVDVKGIIYERTSWRFLEPWLKGGLGNNRQWMDAGETDRPTDEKGDSPSVKDHEDDEVDKRKEREINYTHDCTLICVYE